MRQLGQQRSHECEHDELAGHLQCRDRQQQNDHPVARDIGPGLEIHRRADQPAWQPPRQQKEAKAAGHADAAVNRAPAVMAGGKGDQRQADRGCQRPSKKDESAAALFR
jgi:hypothetical protein